MVEGTFHHFRRKSVPLLADLALGDISKAFEHPHIQNSKKIDCRFERWSSL